MSAHLLLVCWLAVCTLLHYSNAAQCASFTLTGNYTILPGSGTLDGSTLRVVRYLFILSRKFFFFLSIFLFLLFCFFGAQHSILFTIGH
jgi:hypothetical protein